MKNHPEKSPFSHPPRDGQVQKAVRSREPPAEDRDDDLQNISCRMGYSLDIHGIFSWEIDMFMGHFDGIFIGYTNGIGNIDEM